MLKSKKLFLAICCAVGLTMGYASNVSASTPSQRISGQTRYETAVETSKFGWDKSYYAVLVNGENFPDALSAAPLAKKYDAPILLTKSDELDNKAFNELKRLETKQVFIVGGTGVVDPSIESQLNHMGILTIRIAGFNRYETSVKVAEKLGYSDKMVVTVGDSYTDALSIAPIAAKLQMPIILTAKNGVDPSLEKYLNAVKVNKTYILGDSSLISDAVVNKLPRPERIVGDDKYERNVNIINKFIDQCDLSRAYIASGEGFADGLAGSAIAPKTSSFIVLTSDEPAEATKDFMKERINYFKEVDILGGEGSVSQETLEKLGGITKAAYVSDLIEPFFPASNYCETNTKMMLGGKTYEKGYKFSPWADKYSFNLDGEFDRLSGLIGIQEYKPDDFTCDVNVEVYGDDKLLQTYELKPGDIPQNFDVNVAGVTKLDIVKKSERPGQGTVNLVNLVKDAASADISKVKDITSQPKRDTNEVTYLSDVMAPYYPYVGAGIKVNGEMMLGGKKYNKGYKLSIENDTYNFNLEGKVNNISGLIGIQEDDKEAFTCKVTVNIYGDDKLIKTIELAPGELPTEFNIDVRGVHKLSIVKSSERPGLGTVNIVNVVEDGQTPKDDPKDNKSLKEAVSMSDLMAPYYPYAGAYCETNSNMILGGKPYNKGYKLDPWANNVGMFSFNLEGKYTEITGLIGIQEYDAEAGSSDVNIKIYGDGKLIKNYDLVPEAKPLDLKLDVTGVKKLDIVQNSKIYGKGTVHIVNPMIK